MGTLHLMRKRVLQYATEDAYNTYGSDTVYSVPILDDITVRPWAGNQVARNTVRPYFGTIRSIPVGEYATVEFSVELGGSGTAATAPAYAGLLAACGMASQSTLQNAATGTAQAGATSTITLASGASSTDGLYVGMTVSLTGGTGSDQTREIIAYNGTSKVATVSAAWATNPDSTSVYSIGANVTFLPVSAWGDGTSVTLWAYVGAESSSDAVLHRISGARGNVTLEFAKDSLPRLRFSLMGLVHSHSDTTLPSTSFTAWQAAVPVTTANTGTGLQIASVAGVVLDSLSIDCGMGAIYRGAVNDTGIRITSRAATGRANVAAWDLSEADFFAKCRQGAEGPLLIKHGTTAGNIVTVVCPAIQITGTDYADSDGIAHLDLAFSANAYGSAGNDEVRIVTK